MDKELLQIIGRVYVDLYRTSSLLQQSQQHLQQKDEQISVLEEQVRGLQSAK